MSAFDGLNQGLGAGFQMGRQVRLDQRQGELDALKQKQLDFENLLKQTIESRKAEEAKQQIQHMQNQEHQAQNALLETHRHNSATEGQAVEKTGFEHQVKEAQRLGGQVHPLSQLQHQFPGEADNEMNLINTYVPQLAKDPAALTPREPGVVGPQAAPTKALYDENIVAAGQKFKAAQDADNARKEAAKAESASGVQKRFNTKQGMLDAPETKTVDARRSAIRRLNNIEDAAKKVTPGKINKYANKAWRSVGADDPEFTEFATTVQNSLVQNIKDISGTAVNEGEYARLQALMPNEGDTFSNLMAKHRALKKEASGSLRSYYDTLSTKGRNVKSFVDQDFPESAGGAPAAGGGIAAGTTRTSRKTGVTETFDGSKWVKK